MPSPGCILCHRSRQKERRLMSRSKLLGIVLLVLLAATTWGQTGEPHFPPAIRAELPLYPPLPRAAHVTGTVEIQATLQGGAVADARVVSVELRNREGQSISGQTDTPVARSFSSPILANIKTW